MRIELVNGPDVSVELLCALATLPPGQREAWVDTYMVGGKAKNGKKQLARTANQRLRDYFGSSDTLAEAV